MSITPIDLEPAGERLIALVEAVPDDALGRLTPCSAYTVGDLLDHVAGFLLAFRAAAVKQPLEQAPAADASRLASDWRTRMPADVRALVDAWRDPDAWTGTTAVGGVELPGEVAGTVALDELVLHGWDLARSLGLPSHYDGPGLDAVEATVWQFRASGIDGLFGPEVVVADDAPQLDRVLGLAGRDPD